jgi:hypothetical protein
VITFACVFVRGHVNFTPEYVYKLQSMVARHYREPHRFVCLTDQNLLDVECIRTPPIGNYFAWWKKLELFAAPTLDRGRVVYLDLDSIVIRDLTPIVEFPAPFALIPHAGTFKPKPPYKIVPRFNSSCMVWEGGTMRHIYENWSEPVTRRLWGDQDFIGELVSTSAAKTFPREWFPRLSEVRDGSPSQFAKVVLCKKPKNVDAAALHPWVKEAWA